MVQCFLLVNLPLEGLVVGLLQGRRVGIPPVSFHAGVVGVSAGCWSQLCVFCWLCFCFLCQLLVIVQYTALVQRVAVLLESCCGSHVWEYCVRRQTCAARKDSLLQTFTTRHILYGLWDGGCNPAPAATRYTPTSGVHRLQACTCSCRCAAASQGLKHVFMSHQISL